MSVSTVSIDASRSILNRIPDMMKTRKFIAKSSELCVHTCELFYQLTSLHPKTKPVGAWVGKVCCPVGALKAGVDIWNFIDDIKPSEEPETAFHRGMRISANICYGAGDLFNVVHWAHDGKLIPLPKSLKDGLSYFGAITGFLGLGLNFIEASVTISEQNRSIFTKNQTIAEEGFSAEPAVVPDAEALAEMDKEAITKHNQGVNLRNTLADAKEIRKRTIVDMVQIVFDVAAIVLGLIALGVAALVPTPIFAIPAAILGIISASIGIWKLWDDTKAKVREPQIIPV